MKPILIEGMQILDSVPRMSSPTSEPKAVLSHGLTLTDANFFQYPTVILGGVGSGKSTLMRKLMDAVLPHADASGDTVVIFAAKPELRRYCRKQDILINVSQSDSDEQSTWNIFSELFASDDPELCIREIADALFAGQESSIQPFFVDAARNIFDSTLRYLFNYCVENNVLLTNAYLVDFIQNTPITCVEDGIPGWIEYSQLAPEYFSMLRDYLGDGSSSESKSVLAELRTLISRVFFGSFASSGSFSAIQAVKEGGKRIVLYFDYAHASHRTLLLYKIIVDLLMKQSLSAENTHKIWFFLDEYSLLGRLQNITDLLSFGRDPGSNTIGGVRTVISLQSARLLAKNYPQAEAEMLLSLFPNAISFRVSDPLSRSVIADRYGEAVYQYPYTDSKRIDHDELRTKKVCSDADFAKLILSGDAIMSLPGICDKPFFYHGHKEGVR